VFARDDCLRAFGNLHGLAQLALAGDDIGGDVARRVAASICRRKRSVRSFTSRQCQP
jgi:hypothetical protein